MKRGRLLKSVLWLTAACIIMPAIVLLIWCFAARWPWPGMLPESLSLRTVKELIFGSARLPELLLSSISLSFVVAAISTTIGIATARATELYEFRGKGLIRFFSLLPLLVPGTVLAIGAQIMLLKVGLGDSIAGIILIHTVASVPYCITIMTDVTAALGDKYEEQAAQLMKSVQLCGLESRRINELSGGQQRVALARALVAQPRLLLLDEPFTALDNELKEEIRALVPELHKKFRTTTVLVTHDRQEAPAQGIYDECLAMAQHYLEWDRADKRVCGLIDTLITETGRLPLKKTSGAPVCIVNTELNSGNFLINPDGKSYLIDWEKPLLSEPAQDIAHFLVPTTTFWKTDTILTPEEIAAFADNYTAAVGDRMDTSTVRERLPLFFKVTCLRGITWCAMAMREYSEPGRTLRNEITFKKIQAYLSPDFLSNILENYVRKDFLCDRA